MTQQMCLNQSDNPKFKQATIHMFEYENANNIKDDELIQNNLKKLPRFRKVEIILEIVALIILLASWGYFYKIFLELPEQVPTEFDYSGDVVRYTDKSVLYALPGFETVSYIIVTILQFVPHRFNYDCIGLTVFNAQAIYRATRQVMLYCKVVTELLFTYITFSMLQVVQYKLVTSYMYFAFLFFAPYIVGGFVYYRYIRRISSIVKI